MPALIISAGLAYLMYRVARPVEVAPLPPIESPRPPAKVEPPAPSVRPPAPAVGRRGQRRRLHPRGQQGRLRPDQPAFQHEVNRSGKGGPPARVNAFEILHPDQLAELPLLMYSL